MPFARRLPSELLVKNGPTLATVADARAYVLALPADRAEQQRWQRAAELMLRGAGTDAIWQAITQSESPTVTRSIIGADGVDRKLLSYS
jgi:hypothetical protein